MHPRHIRLVPAGGVLAILLLLTTAERAAAQLFQKVAPARQPLGNNDDLFDQWVFQQDREAGTARQRLEAQLTLQLEAIDQASGLTKGQRQKLELIGRGDIKRFFDRYEQVKHRYQLVKDEQDKLPEIWQEISPLQIGLQTGLFHGDSLLIRSLPHLLSREQFSRYEAMARERSLFHQRARIEMAITVFEQNMPLPDAQRRQLATLLMKETRPPRTYGPYDYHVVLYQLGRLGEDKVRGLFDNLQWKFLQQQLAQYTGLEALLKRSGQLPEEEDAAPPTAPPR